MGKGGDEIKQSNAFLCRLLWPTSRRYSWFVDANTWRLQLPSCGWHPPTSSGGHDWQYRGGIRCWWWDSAQKSKQLRDDKKGFQKFERTPWLRMISQERYLEVIWNCALGLFADYEQSLVANQDEAWICKHDHIVDPPAVGSFANR